MYNYDKNNVIRFKFDLAIYLGHVIENKGLNF